MATRSNIRALSAGAAAVLSMVAVAAYAQDPRPRGEPPGGYQSGPAGGFQGPGPMMRGPVGGGGSAIAVSGDSVFVLQGNALYKFAAGDLTLIKRVQLAPPPPPGGSRYEGGPGPERK
jgi:hypothetical protein